MRNAHSKTVSSLFFFSNTFTFHFLKSSRFNVFIDYYFKIETHSEIYIHSYILECMYVCYVLILDYSVWFPRNWNRKCSMKLVLCGVKVVCCFGL